MEAVLILDMKLSYASREFQLATLFVVFIFGILIGGNMKNSEGSVGDGPVLNEEEIAAREELLKAFLDEQAYLQSRIVDLREAIESAQENVSEQAGVSDISLLERLKKQVGLIEVKGRGLEIMLDDSPLALRSTELNSETVVLASDLRDLVNVVASSKADAISINDQRVVASTAISSVGNAVLVNNSYVTPPFVVKAVGDPQLISQKLLNRALLTSLYQKVEKSGVIMEVKLNNLMNIPVYNAEFRTNLINLVEQ